MRIVDLKQTAKAYQRHKAMRRKLNAWLILAVSIYIISLWGGLAMDKNPLTVCHDNGEPVPQVDYTYKGGDTKSTR